MWLRQEYQPSKVVTRFSNDEELWPNALVDAFYASSLCTVMLDDAPLPGVPQGSVVLLEAGSPFLIGVAKTPEELAAFMRKDHVPHYLIDLHDVKSREDRGRCIAVVGIPDRRAYPADRGPPLPGRAQRDGLHRASGR